MPIPSDWDSWLDTILDIEAEYRRASREFWRALAAMEPEPLWPDDREPHQVTAETLNKMRSK